MRDNTLKGEKDLGFIRGKNIILYIFMFSFFCTSLILLTGVLFNQYYPDEMIKMFRILVKVYSINFAVILPGILTSNSIDSEINQQSFRAAILLSIIWNLLIIAVTIVLVFGSVINVYDYILFLGEYIDSFNFLITGVIAYFFLNRGRK